MAGVSRGGRRSYHVKYDNYLRICHLETEGGNKYWISYVGHDVKVTKNGKLFATYTFSKEKRLTQISYPGTGRKEIFKWDVDGRLLSHTSGKQFIQFSYDKQENLIKELYQDGTSREWVYSIDNLLLSETAINGLVTDYTYDHDTRLLKEKRVGNRTFYYDYNSYGMLIREEEKGPIIHRIKEYDPQLDSSLAGHTLPAIIRKFYVENGKKKLLTRSMNSYDQDLLIKEEVYGADGEFQFQKTYTYDGKRDLISGTDALGQETRSVYNKFKHKVTEVGANHLQCAYNKQGQIIARQSFEDDGSKVTDFFAYNGDGKLLKRVDAIGNVTRYEYDQLGRKVKEIDALDGVHTFTYNVNHLLTSRTDPNGNQTSYEYNEFEKLCYIKHPNESLDQFEYDSFGRVSKKIDQNLLETTFTYDHFDNVTSETKGSQVKQWQYIDNLLVTEVDRMGMVTDYKYDSVGRLIEKITGEHRVTFHYDLLGRMNRERKYISADTFRESIKTFDALDREVEEVILDEAGHIFSKKNYLYDRRGNRIAVITDQGVSKKTFDARSQITSEIDALGNVTLYTYSRDKQFKKTKVDPDGVKTLEVYDGLNRLINEKVFDPFGNELRDVRSVTMMRMVTVSGKSGIALKSVVNLTAVTK